MNYFSKNLRFLRENKGLRQEDFEFLGIKKGTFSNYELGNTEPKLDSLNEISKFFRVSTDRLLNFDLENSDFREDETDSSHQTKEKDILKNGSLDKDVKLIPLYSVEASAGNGSFDTMLKEENIIDRYKVPEFRSVDFMIYVKGSSMYPKYNSGDIIACRILHESKFIQWNKVYVVATREQGLLVKRLKKSNQENCLLAVSDNKTYDPFDIPIDEIMGLALVIGVIRLE